MRSVARSSPAASFLLPVSNPANLLILTRTPLGLGAFIARLLLPSVLALGTTLVGLLWIFRDDLRQPYRDVLAPGPTLTARTRARLVGVSAVGVTYILATLVGWPLGRVAVRGQLYWLSSTGSLLGGSQNAPSAKFRGACWGW